MDVLAHPLTLLLVGFLLTQLVSLGALWVRMYSRLNTVKADTVRIDQVVEGMRADVSELKVSQAQLASDLRNHMNSEERRDAAIVDAINDLRKRL
jgi:hypothetical protein